MSKCRQHGVENCDRCECDRHGVEACDLCKMTEELSAGIEPSDQQVRWAIRIVQEGNATVVAALIARVQKGTAA